jgi:hypothetical protein
VNDNVDEGTSYSDVIETLVWSEVSFTECDMEERTTCGQAAKYSNFSVASQRVLVQDDDEAGVMIGPSLQITATIPDPGSSFMANVTVAKLLSPSESVAVSRIV